MHTLFWLFQVSRQKLKKKQLVVYVVEEASAVMEVNCNAIAITAFAVRIELTLSHFWRDARQAMQSYTQPTA